MTNCQFCDKQFNSGVLAWATEFLEPLFENVTRHYEFYGRNRRKKYPFFWVVTKFGGGVGWELPKMILTCFED